MFSKVHLQNLAAFSDFSWTSHGRINVIVGENDTGKSHLLKILYVVARSAEEFSRRSSPGGPGWSRVVIDKLRWTFQSSSGLAGLVHRGAESATIATILGGKNISFDLQLGGEGRKPTLKSKRTGRDQLPLDVNALFIPPKEILTTFSAIAATRETLEIYGFDDTYYDLIKLLRVPPTQGQLDEGLRAVLDQLSELFQGQITKAKSSDEFTFERGKSSFEMAQTADGIKKIGILTTLIKNRSLNARSILFLDEPETNLHPRAISLFTRMLFQISETGAQVYLATHSYFVIKQLQILAKQHKRSVPFCSLYRDPEGRIRAEVNDLSQSMPQNRIIEESIRLYEEEVEVDLRKRGGK